MLVASIFCIFQLRLRHQQAIPNPDIFQYIGDGYQYLDLKLPDSIHPPPLFPIIITSTAKIIRPFVRYPEIEAATIINIVLTTLSLVGIYIFIAGLYSPVKAFAVVCLYATNQITLLFTRGVTNDVLYTALLVIILNLYRYSKSSLVYLLIGLIFLLRYESVSLLLAIFIIEYLAIPRQLKLKNILLSLTPICLWLVVLNFHSKGTSLANNAYLEEIMFGLKKLPNTAPFKSLIEIITFEPSFPYTYNVFFLVVIAYVFFKSTTAPKTASVQKIVQLTLLFHLMFLAVFPNFYPRYYLPIIWITYLLFIGHHSKLISCTVIICLLSYNLGRLTIQPDFSHPQDMVEYRLLADKLNDTKTDNHLIIATYEPHILKYFVTNPKVEVLYDFDIPYKECHDDIICIAKKLEKTDPKAEILIITTYYNQSQISGASDPYTAGLHHVNAFDFNVVNKNSRFKYQYTVVDPHNENAWAQVFKYQH